TCRCTRTMGRGSHCAPSSRSTSKPVLAPTSPRNRQAPIPARRAARPVAGRSRGHFCTVIVKPTRSTCPQRRAACRRVSDAGCTYATPVPLGATSATPTRRSSTTTIADARRCSATQSRDAEPQAARLPRCPCSPQDVESFLGRGDLAANAPFLGTLLTLPGVQTLPGGVIDDGHAARLQEVVELTDVPFRPHVTQRRFHHLHRLDGVGFVGA